MPKKKISKHTKSFIALFGLAFCGAILALILNWNFHGSSNKGFDKDGKYTVTTYPQTVQQASDNEPMVQVDTSNWKIYKDANYGLSFKYDPKWKIRSIKDRDGYYVIEVDPGIRYDNFRIYISKDDYFAMSGVPTQKTEIAGKEALDLQGMVLGIKDNATYFTFDMGASLSLKPYFQAMIKTIKFE